MIMFYFIFQNLWQLRKSLETRSSTVRLGTLRSNDADGNENVKKKKKGLISKTATLHVHHALSLYISLRFLHDFDVKMPNLAF